MSHIIDTQKAKIKELRATANYATNCAENASEHWEVLEYQQVALDANREADRLEVAIAETELNNL